MSEWGLALARFVGDMAEALEANEYKTGWRHRSPLQLLRRLREETDELEDVMKGDAFENDAAIWKRVRQEAADVANFCMMIADLAREDEAEAADER